MMIIVQMKNLSVIKCWQGTIDLGANNVLISIRETAVCGNWSADKIQLFFISTWTLMKGNRKELLDLSGLKLLKSK